MEMRPIVFRRPPASPAEMDTKISMLLPPFSSTPSLTSSQETVKITHPAIVTAATQDDLIRPIDNLTTYLKMDLIPTRLDHIYKHLHLAGSPRSARPLHRQKLLGRTVVITEDISEHLTWHHSRIFIKPLPSYLLCHDFWITNLCSDPNLHKSACGLLLSYAWLVSRESDFHLARDEMYLLPKTLEWDNWVDLIARFTEKINMQTLHEVTRRYQYGELRLSRLNKIYRYIPAAFSFRNFFKGFLDQSTWYQDRFRKSFGWLLALFAFFSVSLSGLQVGLSTDGLKENENFHNASYGFTVFSLVTLAGSVVVMVLMWLVLFAYHSVTAEMYHRKVQEERKRRLVEVEEMT